MKTIYFKNGTTVRITIETAKEIRDFILNTTDQLEFLIFSDDEDNPWLFINIGEINHIY